MTNPLPNWLKLWFQNALITEVYPQVRAIAVSFSDEHELKVRYYLDREPTEFDFESIAMVVNEVLSNTSSGKEISSVIEECLFSDMKLSDIDPLNGFVYARREYEIQQNPSPNPTYV